MTTTTTRCTQAARHWFAYYGWVRSSAPTCRHCGAPNPRYDVTRDPFAVAAPDDVERGALHLLGGTRIDGVTLTHDDGQWRTYETTDGDTFRVHTANVANFDRDE